jgi:uncharacterized membrane protein
MRQEAKTRTGAVASTQAADFHTESARGRIASIDILRGLVIALMALDHARDFIGGGDFNPRDVTETALFLTRWITHLCAPTFVFLAGMSAFLYGRGKTRGELSRFLLTRGLWLILIEFTLVNFAWSFEFAIPLRLYAGVIFVTGASMLCLAALIFLPRAAIAAIAIVLIAGHNLFDGVRAEELGTGAALWHLLHDPGRIALGGGGTFYTLYTLIPWVGVMAAGYALGPVMTLAAEARRRTLLTLGSALLVGFVLLRATNLYGDPAPWQTQDSTVATLLAFLNCEKYPPSLLFLLMTLGPALLLLATFEHVRGRLAGWLSMFGEVPFFFYVIHLYVLHGAAVLAGYALNGTFDREPQLGASLPAIYAIWLAALLLLYPLCSWFARLKARQSGWWWRYL